MCFPFTDHYFVFLILFDYVGPLLFVSSEDTNEISAFDFVTGECRENFRVLASEKSQRMSLAGIFNKVRSTNYRVFVCRMSFLFHALIAHLL